MKFTAVIATDSKDQLGDIFSHEALEQLSKTASGKILEFDHNKLPFIVNDSWVDNGKLWITIESFVPLYAVPSFRKDNGEYIMESLSLTSTPQDVSLLSIQKMTGDNK